MYTSVLVTLSVRTILGLSVYQLDPPEENLSKSRIELKPVEFQCELNDILILSAPIILAEDVRYYLYNPGGDVTKMDIKRLSDRNKTLFSDYAGMTLRFMKDTPPFIVNLSFDSFNVNRPIPERDGPLDGTSIPIDIFEKYAHRMKPNEFMLGPIGQEDFGNWVLSAYYKDDSGNWTEVYQVYSIIIIEVVPPIRLHHKLRPGDTFKPMFLYSVPNLTSCELTAPAAAVDRYYERSLVEMDRCAFVIPNVTKEETGTWRIIGVDTCLPQVKHARLRELQELYRILKLSL